MSTDSLSQKTLNNAAYGFLGYLYPIIFSILILPVIVKRLGVPQYGIYIFVLTISGFIALLDLGLTTALIKYISTSYARGEREEVQRYVRAANAMYITIGIAGFLVFLFLGSFFLRWLGLDVDNKANLIFVFVIAGITFCVNSATAVYNVIPAALQRFDMVTKVSITQLTVYNLTVLAAVLWGYQLKALMLLNLLAAIFATLLMRRYARQLWPHVSLAFSWDKGRILQLYRFGILAAVANLSGNLLVYLDRLLIPFYLGPVQLSYYSLPGNVALKTPGLTNSLAIAIFPMASSLSSLEDYVTIRTVYRKVFRNITVIAAAITIGIALFSYKILYFWLGRDFAEAGSSVLVILAATYFMLALYAPLYNFLLGIGKTKFLAVNVGCMAVINIICLLVLLPRFGIVGAAVSYLISVLPVVFMLYWTEHRYLNMNGQGKFYGALYSKILLVALLVGGFAHFVLVGWTTSMARLVLAGPCTVLLYLVIYYMFGFFDRDDELLFKNFIIEKVINKLRKK